MEDMIAVRQIMDGADEVQPKREINYDDDSVWNLT